MGSNAGDAARSPLKERNCVVGNGFVQPRMRAQPNHKKQPQQRIASKENMTFLQLQEGLQSVTSSLSLLSETIGSALEESYSLSTCRRISSSPRIKVPEEEVPDDASSKNDERRDDTMQRRQPQELAIGMAFKAKSLLRELRAVRVELGFMKERTAQLEEENRRLRGAYDKNDEEDLVRLQLETLLAEKSRLVQENSAYKRENQLLHDVIDYHQLTL